MVAPSCLLEVKGLSLSLMNQGREVKILHSMSFTIRKGETVVLLGESGSGKSMCALSLLSLLPDYLIQKKGGTALFYDGETVDLLSAEPATLARLRGSKIGMIFQDPESAMNPIHRCGHQVMEAVRWHQKITAKEARIKTLDWFTRLGLQEPERMFQAYPHELSGGQLQRIMIAMALAGDPVLLVADEPTTNLDHHSKGEILTLLESLKSETGLSLLYITHDMAEARRIGEKFYRVEKGEIIAETDHPDAWAEESFPSLKRSVRSDDRQTDPLIRVSGLSKSFQRPMDFFGFRKQTIPVFTNLNLDIPPKRIIGVTGPSGCGKSTLGRILLRMELPDSGTVHYRDKDLFSLDDPTMRSLRQKLQIVYQNPFNTMNGRWSVSTIVREPLDIHRGNIKGAERRQLAREILEKVGIASERHGDFLFQLSGGQRQRVAIARALVLHPEFIVLDECISSLDRKTQCQILELLADLKDRFSLSMLFISHDPEAVHALSDQSYALGPNGLNSYAQP